MKSKYKQLALNTGLLAIGKFSTSFLNLLLMPLYTYVLSTEEYGVYDLIITTSSLLYPFLTLAIGEAILRFTLDRDTDKRTIYSSGLYICASGFLILLLMIPIISHSAIGEYCIFFYVYFLLYCINVITMNFAKGLENVKKYSIAGVLNTSVLIVSNLICLLLLKTGIAGYLLSVIIGQTVSIIYLFFSLKLYKYIQVFWKMDFSLLKNILLYSLPIIPNSISWWISNSSDKYILKYYTDLSQIGIYSVSYKIPSMLMTIMSVFLSAWQLSAVSDFGSKESKNFFADIYKKCVSVNYLFASFVIAFCPIISKFLFAKDFFIAWKYAPILVLANVFNVLSTFLGTVYTSAKKTKMLAMTTISAALANIVMNFILIPRMGAMGAAIATLASYLFMWLFRLINTRKILKFNIDFKQDFLIFATLILQILLLENESTICWILTVIIFVGVSFCQRKLFISLINVLLSKLRKNNGVSNV